MRKIELISHGYELIFHRLKTMKTEYIGDGVYVATWLRHGIKLTTSNGTKDSNSIYLEPEVIGKLIDYFSRHRQSLEREDTSDD